MNEYNLLLIIGFLIICGIGAGIGLGYLLVFKFLSKNKANMSLIPFDDDLDTARKEIAQARQNFKIGRIIEVINSLEKLLNNYENAHTEVIRKSILLEEANMRISQLIRSGYEKQFENDKLQRHMEVNTNLISLLQDELIKIRKELELIRSEKS